MIRVLICDDQDVVRDGLQTILRTSPEIEIVGAARDGFEAVELTAQKNPDVVLMDLKMPVMNGIEATRALHEKFPNVRVLALTTYDADEWVFDALRAGAVGYLLKDIPRRELIAAVIGTAQGNAYLDPKIARVVMQRATRDAPVDSSLFDALTERERAVLQLLGRGWNNARIAQELALSEGTVRNLVSAILEKLDLDDRTQAAVLAVRYGLDQ